MGRADGDDPRAPLALAPLLFERDVDTPPDHLKDRPYFWSVREINKSLGPVHPTRQLAHFFSQGFQTDRLVSLIAPCAEHLGMVVNMTPMIVGVFGVVTLRVCAEVFRGLRIEPSACRIEAPDAQ